MIKIPEGDHASTITELDRPATERHQKSWSRSLLGLPDDRNRHLHRARRRPRPRHHLLDPPTDRLTTDDAEAHIRLAEAFEHLEQKERALAHLERAIRLRGSIAHVAQEPTMA